MRRRQVVWQPEGDALLPRAQDLKLAEAHVEGGAVQDLFAGLESVRFGGGGGGEGEGVRAQGGGIGGARCGIWAGTVFSDLHDRTPAAHILQ